MEYQVKKDRAGKYRVIFACTACQERLNAPIEDAGQTDSCPSCRVVFKTPGEKELENLKRALAEQEAEATRSSAAEAAERKRREEEARRRIEEQAASRRQATREAEEAEYLRLTTPATTGDINRLIRAIQANGSKPMSGWLANGVAWGILYCQVVLLPSAVLLVWAVTTRDRDFAGLCFVGALLYSVVIGVIAHWKAH